MSVETFESLRPLMFSIAYRMLGSVSEAEDVVQDAFLRYESAAAEIASPKAYLSAVVTRLSIDHLRSARVRRETYVGQWLPEPLLTEEGPAAHAEQADTLSMAFLLVLERLSPVEIVGADRVSRLFAGLGMRIAELQLQIEPHIVNGQPGALVRDPEGRVVNVFALDIADGAVQTVRSVINPDKLRHLGPVADAWALARRRFRDD